MVVFYLIHVIFRLDSVVARRFRLTFVRPAAQVNLPAQVRSVIEHAWDDTSSTLDLRRAYEYPMGVRLLAMEVARLASESREPSFMALAEDLLNARVTVVDRIAALDDEHQPSTVDVHHKKLLLREVVVKKLIERHGAEDTR